jgi:hypothetical protein
MVRLGSEPRFTTSGVFLFALSGLAGIPDGCCVLISLYPRARRSWEGGMERKWWVCVCTYFFSSVLSRSCFAHTIIISIFFRSCTFVTFFFSYIHISISVWLDVAAKGRAWGSRGGWDWEVDISLTFSFRCSCFVVCAV